MSLLRLNMGSGLNPVKGFLNVDKVANPGVVDVHWDLEVFPWPWPANSAEAVVFYHSLEHMGAAADTFIGIMKELYRICAPGAKVQIDVPHFRHDNFHGDPTHVRVVSPQVLNLFSRRLCKEWASRGCANTPLALYHGIDFEVRSVELTLEEPWAAKHAAGEIDDKKVARDARLYNNVVRELRIIMEAVK